MFCARFLLVRSVALVKLVGSGVVSRWPMCHVIRLSFAVPGTGGRWRQNDPITVETVLFTGTVGRFCCEQRLCGESCSPVLFCSTGLWVSALSWRPTCRCALHEDNSWAPQSRSMPLAEHDRGTGDVCATPWLELRHRLRLTFGSHNSFFSDSMRTLCSSSPESSIADPSQQQSHHSKQTIKQTANRVLTTHSF